MRHIIVFGTSEAQDFELLDDGSALVGTGLTLGIEFTDEGLSEEQEAAIADVEVEWLNQATGQVRVTGIEGLPVGTYHPRYTLTDSGGKKGYAPNGAAADEWRIVRV